MPKLKIKLYDMSNHEYLKSCEYKYDWPEDLEELLFVGADGTDFPPGIDFPPGYYIYSISFDPTIDQFTYYLFEGGGK